MLDCWQKAVRPGAALSTREEQMQTAHCVCEKGAQNQLQEREERILGPQVPQHSQCTALP